MRYEVNVKYKFKRFSQTKFWGQTNVCGQDVENTSGLFPVCNKFSNLSISPIAKKEVLMNFHILEGKSTMKEKAVTYRYQIGVNN